MSATPAPLSDERLAEIEARLKDAVYPSGLPSGGNNVKFSPDMIEHDVPALLAEVRRLRGKYESTGLRCNAGHVNRLPLALWDCPTCGEELQKKLKAAQDLLLERARQAEELIARLEKVEVHKDRLMDGLATIHDHAMHTHDADWSRYFDFAERTIGVVGSDEIAFFRARRTVVDAALRAHRASQAALGFDDDSANDTLRRQADEEADQAWRALSDATDALDKLQKSDRARRAAEETENGGSRS